MSKLAKDVEDYCLSHAVDNELVVIPESHDTGFDEYISIKKDGVYKGMNTRKRKDECHLELSYPRPGSKPLEFASFFETPSHFAKDRWFRGLLTVDVSPYVTKYNTPEFDSLLDYLKDDLSGVTVLFVVSTASFEKARGISEKLKGRMDVVTTHLHLPSKEQVLAYLKENTRDSSLFEERRDEIAKGIEGMGYEVVSAIGKALKAKTSVPVKRRKERTVTFGY